MTTRDALVDAVMDAPDDLATRLVLGDWLAERGDPWGEVILHQCAGKSSPRLAALLADTSWLGPLHSPHIRWVFRGGLPAAFQLAGEFRYQWPDPVYIASYLLAIRFRSDNKCSEELWELTQQDPARRAYGTYELSPWEALRGHGAIGIRMTYESENKNLGWQPYNGDVSHGVLRGEQLFVHGRYVTGLMHHGTL